MTVDAGRRSLRIVSHPVAGVIPPLSPRDPGDDSSPTALLLPSAAAERLGQPGAVAVTTGQQPGLFGGPMYVVHKAVAAAALARSLERAWQRPVVPVFWMAGDDHDWDEATSTAWWSPQDEVVEWSLPARADHAPQRPMAAEPLPIAAITAARDRLAGDLPRGAPRDRTIAWIDRHWHPGATIHSAFVAGMRELLEPLGVACLDAPALPIKRAQVALIRAALDLATELDDALSRLPDHAVELTTGQGLTLVFLDAAAGRDRLVRDGDGFMTRRSRERFSRAALDGLLESAPERFSANVLLRPVVEAALLPTAAYVAGPGERRYLTAQASALYPILGVAPQAAVPRWSGSVVDPVSDRLLDRLRLDAADVLADTGALGRQMVRRDLDPAIPIAVQRLGQAIDDTSAALQVAGKSIDAVLERAIESRRRKLRLVTDDLERLMERHHKKRDGITWAQYRRLRARLVPLDGRQERVIGVAAALGQWGDAWIEQAGAAAETWAAGVADAAVTGPGSDR